MTELPEIGSNADCSFVHTVEATKVSAGPLNGSVTTPGRDRSLPCSSRRPYREGRRDNLRLPRITPEIASKTAILRAHRALAHFSVSPSRQLAGPGAHPEPFSARSTRPPRLIDDFLRSSREDVLSSDKTTYPPLSAPPTIGNAESSGNEAQVEGSGIPAAACGDEQLCDEPSRLKRRWQVPMSHHAKFERDVILYYLKAPTAFTLLLVVSARNVLGPGGDRASDLSAWPPAVQETLRGQKDDANAGPCLLTYLPPIVVCATFGFPGARHPQAPPFEYIIGRSHQQLDKVPADARRWFSRRHCVVQAHPGRQGEVYFMLRDLQSANGTFLNGRPVAQGAGVPLHDGDLIGVSMTDSGGFMVGFRFMVHAFAERVWVGDASGTAWSAAPENKGR